MSDAADTRGGKGRRLVSASRVSALVGGTLVGDGEVVVSGVAPLDRAGPTDLSVFLASRYAGDFARTRAGVVLVVPNLADAVGSVPARVVVDSPHEALLSVLPMFDRPAAPVPGVHPSAVIREGVRLGDGVSIGPHVVIGPGASIGDRCWIDAACVIGESVEVGDDVRLHPGVTLYPGAVLGNRVVVHSGARVAVDGFG